MSSRVEELYAQTRNHPVWSYLIPLESILAYPIPVLEGNATYLKFIVYQRGWSPSGTPRPVYPPHARLVIEFPSGRLIEYEDITQKVTGEPVGEYPHALIANLSVKDMLAKKSEYFSLTEVLIPLLGRSPETQADRDVIQKYKALANMLFEPGLRPYYRELNPVLFTWLDAGKDM